MSQLYYLIGNIFIAKYSRPPNFSQVIILPSKSEPYAGAIVMLHGWGANSQDLVSLSGEVGNGHFQFLFPEGPYDVPGTWGEGKGWFTFPPTVEFETERLQSRKEIFRVLDSLRTEGTPAEKVFLLGFSQGASMSLDVVMNYKDQVAGVAALSGFLIDQESLPNRNDLPLSMPVFWGHGMYDPLIPLNLGKQSYNTLIDLGFNVEWHEYPMAHQIIPEELQDIRNFISKLFPEKIQ